ncbi:MAG: hypothetical protein GYB65_23045, partial [Chloroflexi bacterium]|nr:hypothetical protein [Chloroflexota bacterium]
MNRQLELFLTILLLLLALVLRVADLAELPPGFNTDELAFNRMTELMRDGDVAVHYDAGDGVGRAGMYALGNMLVTQLTGDGLLGYRLFSLWGGMVSLALLYLLARRLFGPYVALIALGLMSVNLRAIMLSRSATSEVFVPLYLILTLLVLAMTVNLSDKIRFRAPATLPFSMLAVLFGAAGYL